jgi:O-antigen/teichoic acid export membrane protein
VFAVVPVVLHHLGSERYGVFATITAIAGLVGWADLGIGNGVLTEVAAAQGRDDSASIGRVVSTAFFALLGLSLVLAAVFAVAYPFVPWDSIFNVSGDAASGVREAAAAFALGILLALPLGVVQRTEIGLQETFVASAWQALGSVLTLAGVILAAAAGASLPYFVLAVSAAPAVALAGNAVELFYRRRTWLRPSFGLVDRITARRLLRVGSLFFAIQISMAVAYESDALVLTQILGPSAVTTYSVTMRVFLVVVALAGFVLAPLWPAYGEAISRGDAEWVRQALRRALRGGLLLSISGAVLLTFVAPPLIHSWTGLRPPFSLVVAAAIWIVVLNTASILSVFLNGAREIRSQMVLAVLMMASNLGLSIAFTRWIGISGVIWGSIAAESVVVVIISSVIVPRVLRRLDHPTPQLS